MKMAVERKLVLFAALLMAPALVTSRPSYLCSYQGLVDTMNHYCDSVFKRSVRSDDWPPQLMEAMKKRRSGKVQPGDDQQWMANVIPLENKIKKGYSYGDEDESETNYVDERSLVSDPFTDTLYYKCCSSHCNNNEWKSLCFNHYMREPRDYSYYLHTR